MKPILFTIGAQPISSFGLFLMLSLIASTFIIWRIIKVYDFDQEEALDLVLLTFIGGVIFARIYFILFHLPEFDTFYKIILINKHPGLSFWGGFFGGILTLSLFAKKLKLNFWQAADFAIPGLFLGLSISSIGCLLGSCLYGLPADLPIAVEQIGLLGKRFPLQIIESALFFIGFLYFWRATVKFHFTGQITSLGLIFFSLVKLILEFFRGKTEVIFFTTIGTTVSILLFFLGILLFYKLAKRSLSSDISRLLTIKNPKTREKLTLNLKKNWYNVKVNSQVVLKNLTKKILRILNVKTNPPQF